MKTAFLLALVLPLHLYLCAKNFPTEILFKKYQEQVPVLDSIRNILNEKNYPDALQRYTELEQWSKEAGDDQLLLGLKLLRISYEYAKGEPSAEIELRTKEFIRESNAKKNGYFKAEGLQFLAEYYWASKNFAPALENYILAYEIYSHYSIDEFPRKAEFLYSLGGRYYYFRDYQTAKKYFIEVWQNIPAEKINNQVSKLNTLALCFSNLEKYDSALHFFKKAEEYAIKNGDGLWVGIISGNMGNNYLKQNQIDSAIPLMEKNIALSKKHNLKDDLVHSLSGYGEIILLKGDAQKSLSYQLEAMAIVYSKALQKNNTLVARIYPNVAKAYAANGLWRSAYLYLDSAVAALKIVEKERNLLYVSGVQHKIDIEKHRSELLSKETELKHQKRYRNTLLAGFAVMLLFSIVFFRQRNRIAKEKKVSDVQKQRSEELLLNILPAEVAEELKNTGGARAKSFDNVSVLFTDFVNFTGVSEKLTPEELVKEIHICFTEFDKIIERNGLEKIKTIGDAYLAVCGMPVVNELHAIQTVRAAIEIRNFIRKRQGEASGLNSEIFNIRIGIHSGPVVAGIVGVKKFAYDIWGDTVNTAARMEQHGEDGKVNISGSTYDLVKNDFTCVYRGKIEAKNKGKVDMYFVE